MSITIRIEPRPGSGSPPQWTCEVADNGGRDVLTVTGSLNAVIAALHVALDQLAPNV